MLRVMLDIPIATVILKSENLRTPFTVTVTWAEPDRITPNQVARTMMVAVEQSEVIRAALHKIALS